MSRAKSAKSRRWQRQVGHHIADILARDKLNGCQGLPGVLSEAPGTGETALAVQAKAYNFQHGAWNLNYSRSG